MGSAGETTPTRRAGRQAANLAEQGAGPVGVVVAGQHQQGRGQVDNEPGNASNMHPPSPEGAPSCSWRTPQHQRQSKGEGIICRGGPSGR